MAEKRGVLLNTVRDFPAETAQRLAGYWITTVQELLNAAAQEGGLDGLAQITGLAPQALTALIERAQAALPPGVPFAPGELTVFGLGAADDPDEQPGKEPPPSFAPLPPAVDLHARLGPVRNQGQRGTCVAHACSAVREYLSGPASAAADFSEQHLYWNCKAHDLLPGAGTFIRVGMSRLQEDGVAGEADWPYNPNVIPGNEGHGPPPTGLEGRAAANKIQSYTTLAATSVPALRQALADGSPIAFAVPVYNSWFSAPANTTGDIRLPLPGEKSAGGHAMCIVGYETDPDVPGGGFFLVRNSWGTGWAGQNPTAPGHARLPFAYMEKHGKSAYIAYAPGEAVKPKTLGQRLKDWLRGLFG